MAEDLVARGLPYGENQRAEQAQRQAGLPTTIEGASPDPSVRQQVRSAASQSTPQAGARPDAPMSEDPLMVLNPTSALTVPPTPRQRLEAIMERTSNPMMRLIAARLREG